MAFTHTFTGVVLCHILIELFLNKAAGRLSSTKAREGAPQWEGKAEMTVRGKPSLD
jgi:hypothetical protein